MLFETLIFKLLEVKVMFESASRLQKTLSFKFIVFHIAKT